MTEVNAIINPVMMKVYSEGGGEMPGSVPTDGMPDMSGMPGMTGSGDPGPTLDEVD